MSQRCGGLLEVRCQSRSLELTVLVRHVAPAGKHESNKQLNEPSSCVRETNSGCTSTSKHRRTVFFTGTVPKTLPNWRDWMYFSAFFGDS